MARVKGAHSSKTGGQSHLLAARISALLPDHRNGKLRGIAVTPVKRSPRAPEFPTIAETGRRDPRTHSGSGIVSPAATPREITARLQTDIVQSL